MPTDPLWDEYLADKELNYQGSVMGSARKPNWQTGSPLVDTGLSMLDSILKFGPTPQDAIPGGGKIAHSIFGGSLANSLLGNPVDQSLGFGGGEQEAGIRRVLGRERQAGSLNPAQYLARLFQLPDAARAKHLTEWIVKRGLKPGESTFTGYRGRPLSDPLTDVLNTGRLPSSTAISTKESTASHFAGGTTDRITAGEYPPESVLSFLPGRMGKGKASTSPPKDTYSHEREIIVDPRWATKFNVTGEPGGHGYTRPVDQLTTDAMNEALAKLGPHRPFPGSGFTTDLGYTPAQVSEISKYVQEKGLAEKLKAQKHIETGKYTKPIEQPQKGTTTTFDSPSNKNYMTGYHIVPNKPNVPTKINLAEWPAFSKFHQDQGLQFSDVSNMDQGAYDSLVAEFKKANQLPKPVNTSLGATPTANWEGFLAKQGLNPQTAKAKSSDEYTALVDEFYRTTPIDLTGKGFKVPGGSIDEVPTTHDPEKHGTGAFGSPPAGSGIDFYDPNAWNKFYQAKGFTGKQLNSLTEDQMLPLVEEFNALKDKPSLKQQQQAIHDKYQKGPNTGTLIPDAYPAWILPKEQLGWEQLLKEKNLSPQQYFNLSPTEQTKLGHEFLGHKPLSSIGSWGKPSGHEGFVPGDYSTPNVTKPTAWNKHLTEKGYGNTPKVLDPSSYSHLLDPGLAPHPSSTIPADVPNVGHNPSLPPPTDNIVGKPYNWKDPPLTGFTLHDSAGGSQGARWATGPDGNKYVIKGLNYKDEDRTAAEKLAASIYKILGIDVPHVSRATYDGKPVTVSLMTEGAPRKSINSDPILMQGMMTDALVANHDVVGVYDFDNVLYDKAGKPKRIDFGGTFGWKATGGAKQFSGDDIPEIKGLLDPKINPHSAQAFKGIKPGQMQQQATHIADTLTEDVLADLVSAAGFKDPKKMNEIHKALRGRINIMREYGQPGMEFLTPPIPSSSRESKDLTNWSLLGK